MISKPTPKPKARKPLKSKRRTISGELREAVFSRDNYRCQWCQVNGGAIEAHHILPRGRGGTDAYVNLISLHRQCHRYVHEHPAEAKPLGFLA